MNPHPVSLAWQPVDPAFKRRLDEAPAAAIQRIRELWESRNKHASNPELHEQLNWLQRAINPNPNQKDHVSKPAWNVLMHDCGLCAFYLQLVLSDGFFEEETALVVAALGGLANTSKACMMGDVETERLLVRHCETLFHTLWQNRESLKRIASEGDLDDGTGEEHPAAVCVFYLSLSYERVHGYKWGYDTKIPHVALFCWVYLKGARSAMGGMSLEPENPTAWPPGAFESFIQEVAIDSIGLDSLFARFEEVLDGEIRKTDADTSFEQRVMLELTRHPKLRPLLHERRIFERIAGLLQRRDSANRSGGIDRDATWFEWECAYSYLAELLADAFDALAARDPSRVTLRGEDCMAMLAIGTTLVAHEAIWRKPDYEERVSKGSHGIAESLKTLCLIATSREWCNFAPELAAGVSRAAAAAWLPSLDVLLSAKEDLSSSGAALNALLNAWVTFGMVLGLDESQERKRRRKFCSYQPCPFYRQEPPGALSTCKGCGEARYCGKECQRKDWKAHKRVCGNRLK